MEPNALLIWQNFIICKKWVLHGRVSDINLTETRWRVDRIFLPSTEPAPILTDAGTSCFSRSETIAFACVSDLCLQFEFLT
jgi:hypothetical protein